MYNWYWLLVLILSIFQPVLSENVIDGRQCCLYSSSPPLRDDNVFLNKKYHVDNANSRLTVGREIHQYDRRYERRDGELGREDTRLSVARHVERQIFALSDNRRSTSRTTEANGRRLHRSFRDVRPEPQIRTYLETRNNFRFQDRSSEPQQSFSHISHRAERINRTIRRSVINEDISPKKDTETRIDRTQNRISETPRNDNRIFRNTIRYSRDISQRSNSVSQQRVRQIEDGQEHITISLDRSHKLKRSISQRKKRTPDRNTNLRDEHFNTRRIKIDILRQRSAVSDHDIRQSDVRRSRMEETKTLRFDSTDKRINERDNSKLVASDERDVSEQSTKRVMGRYISRNREELIGNLRRERRDERNRERFVQENSPANTILMQRELARQSFLRKVHITDRNEYNALNVHRDYRNNERLARDTARTELVDSNLSRQKIGSYNERLKIVELRNNERSRSDSAVCQWREIRNTCARVKKTDERKDERYADKKKIARSVDRIMQSDTFTDQLVTNRLRRNLSIHRNDIFVKHNIRPTNVRMLTIERSSRNREQRNAPLRDKDSNSDISESNIENNLALNRNSNPQKLRINDGRITRSQELERLIIRQKRTGFRNYQMVLGSGRIDKNVRRIRVTRFVRSREQLEENKYEAVRNNKLDAKRISSVQYSRSSDKENRNKRNIPFRNNSRHSKIDSREKTFILERIVDTVNMKRLVPSTSSRTQEKYMIRDIDRSKTNFERYVRDHNRDRTNDVTRNFRQQNNRIFAYEDITDTESESNTNKRTNIRNNKRNTLRIIHETSHIRRNIMGRRIFRTGEHIIREEYGNNRNHKRNSRHTERLVTLEQSIRQTDIRNTNRRLTENREEHDTTRVERKDVLNNKRDRSLSVDSVETQSQTRNNHRREIKNRENDYHRNTNRYTRDQSDKREDTRTGLRNVEVEKLIQNRDARARNLRTIRTHTKNMENKVVREVTYERNLNVKDEHNTIGVEHQIRTNKARMEITKRMTRAREERRANSRDEERRQLRATIHQRKMYEEFTRLRTELTPRRTNVNNVRDIENRQRSTSDVYREFRKMDMERDQFRRNIEFESILRIITLNRSFSADSKSAENSYSSLFYWQYLFYAIQGFYIFSVFKQMLRQKDTDKKTSFIGWTSQRAIKVD